MIVRISRYDIIITRHLGGQGILERRELQTRPADGPCIKLPSPSLLFQTEVISISRQSKQLHCMHIQIITEVFGSHIHVRSKAKPSFRPIRKCPVHSESELQPILRIPWASPCIANVILRPSEIYTSYKYSAPLTPWQVTLQADASHINHFHRM